MLPSDRRKKSGDRAIFPVNDVSRQSGLGTGVALAVVVAIMACEARQLIDDCALLLGHLLVVQVTVEPNTVFAFAPQAGLLNAHHFDQVL